MPNGSRRSSETTNTLLLTGAGGVLGSATLQILRDSGKYNIHVATTQRGKYAEMPDVTPIEVNLLNPREREELFRNIGPSLLVHLAWDQRSSDFRYSASNYEWLLAGLDILRLFALNGGRRAVFAGSSSEYEKRAGGMTENGRERRMSSYGECKLALTNASLPYALNAGIELVVARYFTIYGEGDTHEFGAIPSAIRAFARGERVVCKSPRTIRDYVYAPDAAGATAALLESDLTGVINVATGRPSAMMEIFNTIAEEMNCKDLLSFDLENIASDILTADVSRMTDELRFRCRTDFRDGIRNCIAAFLRGM